MPDREPHFGPRPQTDLEAANSAEPDTERKPYGDDPEWEAYIFATDRDFYYGFMHPEETPPGYWEEGDEDEDDWDDEGYDDDDDDDEEDAAEDPGLAADEADMQRIAGEWAAYDRDPDGT